MFAVVNEYGLIASPQVDGKVEACSLNWCDYNLAEEFDFIFLFQAVTHQQSHDGALHPMKLDCVVLYENLSQRLIILVLLQLGNKTHNRFLISIRYSQILVHKVAVLETCRRLNAIL